MKVLNSRSLSESLESYARGLLAESTFFSALAAGQADPEHVRIVFGQYYLWHNRLHRWIGVCVAKSAPFDEGLYVPRVLGGLIAFLRQEIKGDHHRSARSLLAALGISDPARIEALAVTNSYAESFLRCYSSGDHTGDEALAALAGAELVAASRNQIITSALGEHYGVTSGLEFFSLDCDLETKHFRALWRELVRDHKGELGQLIEAARMEIWEHVTFWDDVYYTILDAESELAS
jgi:hypothetical protein